MTAQPSCEARVEAEMADTLDTLRKIWTAYQEGDEERHEDLGTFAEYGLGFDYVAPETFCDQKQGYFRYQICWGGPSEEFRFYVNPDLSCYRVEYWFLDWFDGASRELDGEDERLLMEIWEFFSEIGSVEHALSEAE